MLFPTVQNPSRGTIPPRWIPQTFNSSQQWFLRTLIPIPSTTSETTRRPSVTIAATSIASRWIDIRRLFNYLILGTPAATPAPTTTPPYDPTAPENSQIVLYRGPQDPTPSLKPFTLPTLPPYIKEALTQRNTMFFGLGSTSAGFMATAITTSTPLFILALIIGGIAFSIFRYKVEYQPSYISPNDPIFAHDHITIATKEEAFEYLEFPLDTTDKARIKHGVDVLLKKYNKYLQRTNPSAPLHKTVATLAKHTITSYNLLK